MEKESCHSRDRAKLHVVAYLTMDMREECHSGNVETSLFSRRNDVGILPEDFFQPESHAVSSFT